MQKEIDSAVQFICGLLQARCMSLDLVETFRRVLCEVMYGHYEGHWFPDKPLRGMAYRCIRINSNSMDPLIVCTAARIGLSPTQLLQLLPNQLTIWVDPQEVSYRFGEDGSVATLYDGRKQQRIGMEVEDDLGSTGSGSGAPSVASSDSTQSSPSHSPTPTSSDPSSTDEDEDDSMLSRLANGSSCGLQARKQDDESLVTHSVDLSSRQMINCSSVLVASS